jgi:glucosamine-6-phosphate deaminase
MIRKISRIDRADISFSNVEKAFIEKSVINEFSTTIPYIVVDNFPKLGLITSLRFLEWVAENPEGVISLPTGKTPEFFIRWTDFMLKNWNNAQGEKMREMYGLKVEKKPVLSGLQFVQIDEFYPINSKQHNSFFDYVNNFYIRDFGMDKNKSLLINSDQIPLYNGRHFNEVFPDGKIDLSLRYREARSLQEDVQQKSIFLIDDWCSDYEQQIRDKGGLGFFLGGIGPDGHIAFNVRGSDEFSTTRLTATNFETQAVAASDLGGIEISKNKLVITIGLETITYNPDAVAIIIAAGEAKAGVVKQSLENKMSNLHPASVLAKLHNGRFYLTQGAACQLNDLVNKSFRTGEWTHEKSEKAVVDLCKKVEKFGHRLTMEDLKTDTYTGMIPDLDDSVVQNVMDSIEAKIKRGLKAEENQVFLHTGPHHDDIPLGILPFITKHISTPSNKFRFAVMTSGFTAVTNRFMIDLLNDTKRLIDKGQIQMTKYSDFFEVGYKLKSDKDVYHYLNNVASGNKEECRRGVCHRLVRALVETYNVKNVDHLRDTLNEVIVILRNSYDGEKNPPKIQQLKGMIREFEEELVWAHFGVQVKNVSHLRLGFYKGDIFTEQPKHGRDVEPILNLLKEVRPTVVSLTFDPEGSGPDTHYKVLQATAEALRMWKQEEDLSQLRIWGYRNVWYRFNPAEANIIFPVSLNAMAEMNDSFSNCYVSQVEASFPSYELNGKFSALAQKIWVEQLKDVQLLLGKNYFYLNDDPRIRAAHGLLYVKEMSVDEFLLHARELKESMEGMAVES